MGRRDCLTRMGTLGAIAGVGLAGAATMSCGSKGNDCIAGDTCATLEAGPHAAYDALRGEDVVTSQSCTDENEGEVCVVPPLPECVGDVLVTHGFPGRCVGGFCSYGTYEFGYCTNCSSECLPFCRQGDTQNLCDPRGNGGCATVAFCAPSYPGAPTHACQYEPQAENTGDPDHQGKACLDGDPCTTGSVCCTEEMANNWQCFYGECVAGSAIADGDACEHVEGTCQAGACDGYCGDGAINVAGEECDDGDANLNDSDNGDGCSTTCTVEPGWICEGDVPAECSLLVEFGCSSCVSETLYECSSTQPSVCRADCGDGIRLGDELSPGRCDDGNETGGDGCSDTCFVETYWECTNPGGDNQPSECSPICGDGHAVAGYEECDDSDTDNQDDCKDDCTPADCGDGIPAIRATGPNHEDCDDADGDDQDDCTNGCKTASCGDGIAAIRATGTDQEECDDGDTDDQDDCTNACDIVECGDGIAAIRATGDNQEECDDADGDNQDDCKNNCEWAVCGDDVDAIRATGDRYEQCDDGDSDNQDNCKNSCEWTVCGDGVVAVRATGSLNEECEDGNANNHDDCTNACAWARCGDDIPAVDADPTGGRFEECDDANGENQDDCKNDCKWAWCGDKVHAELAVDREEACDDGPENGSYNRCKSDCSGIGPHCTDGTCDPEEDSGCGVCPQDCAGMACNDNYCKLGQTCQSDGTCGGGYNRNCNTYGSWSSCGYPYPCDESGTRSRTRYNHTCNESTDACVYTSTTTEYATCYRDTDGNSCTGGICSDGECEQPPFDPCPPPPRQCQ